MKMLKVLSAAGLIWLASLVLIEMSIVEIGMITLGLGLIGKIVWIVAHRDIHPEQHFPNHSRPVMPVAR
jgi:hypothetical protein